MPIGDLADDVFDAATGVSQKLAFDAHRLVPQVVETTLLDQARIQPGFLNVARHDELGLPQDDIVESTLRDAVESGLGFEFLPLRIEPANPLHGSDDRHLGRAARPPDSRRGNEIPQTAIKAHDRGEGTEAPILGHGGEQTPLPQIPAEEQFVAQSVGHEPDQFPLLFFEYAFELFERARIVGDKAAAPIENPLYEVDQVRTA